MQFLLKLTFTYLLYSTALHSMEMEVVQQAPRVLKAESFQSSIIDKSGRQTQLKVANQFDRKTGAASCGFEAFLNAYILSTPQIEEQEAIGGDIEKKLQSIEKRKKLFGDFTKPWQKVIAIKRARKALQDEICLQLIESLKCEKRITVSAGKSEAENIVSFGSYYIVEILNQEPSSLQEIKELISRLQNVAYCINETHFEDSTLTCKMTSNQIRALIVNAELDSILGYNVNPEGQKEPVDESQVKIIREQLAEKLNNFLEVKDIDLVFQLEDVEWLTDDEIRILRRTIAKGYYIFRVGSGITRGDPLAMDFNFLGKKFKNFLDDYRDPQKNAHAGFVLYIKDHPLSMIDNIFGTNFFSSDNGHWVTVVIHKEGDQIEFLLTNSSNNSIIINHPRVLELMEYLDGKVTDETRSLHHSIWTKPQAIAALLVVALIAAISQQNRLEHAGKKLLRSANIADDDSNVELPPYGVLPLSLHQAQVCRLYSELAVTA